MAISIHPSLDRPDFELLKPSFSFLQGCLLYKRQRIYVMKGQSAELALSEPCHDVSP
jgi:hypothetical protein